MLHAKKSPKKSNKNADRKIQLTHKHALTVIGIVLLIWVVLGIAINNRYQQAKLSQLPKQNQVLKLESLNWKNIADNKAESKPVDGYKYISVTAHLKNISPSPIWLAPVLQSYIKDKVGHIYDISLLALDNPLNGGQYEPNQTAVGELGFMVPKNDTTLIWCYEAKQGEEKSAVCQPISKDNEVQ